LTLAEPMFPPLLNGRVVVKGENPTALAISGAQSGELGAGDTLWLQDLAQVDLAIVLEPDDPLDKSIQMLPLAVAAAGDCLSTLTPPQVGLQFRWPGTLLLNGADVGACALTAPDNCEAAAVPAWMVLNFALRFSFDETFEPGSTPGVTSLVEEGGEELSTADVLESFSRHFLSLLDTWSNDGFENIAESWSGRLEGLGEAVEIPHPAGTISGRALGLDEGGNLLVKPDAGDTTVALPLMDCVARPSTIDTP
jgi:BirA family transcriptional regulator, biotin operon repressor / biotin---[acetyl-CoA-carboxylase] ligase